VSEQAASQQAASKQAASQQAASQQAESIEQIAEQVATALQMADLRTFADLLDPNVRWGPPGDPSPPCQSREQVIAWYHRGRESGASARVNEVTVVGDRILVGLVVTRTKNARERGGRATRWQVLTVRDGRIGEIVGFDQRDEATAWLEGLPAPS
jgi:ketosteroid isomerase-like protein